MGVGVMRDENLKLKELNVSYTLDDVGRTYNHSGHAGGGSRPGQM